MEKYFINISKIRTWKKPYLASRLPEHYYKFRRQLELPSSVGYNEKSKAKFLNYRLADSKTGRIERVREVPIPVIYPVESNQGIWAGQGIVKGFTLPKKKIDELREHVDPKIWYPKLIKSVLYSEILDSYYEVVLSYTAKDSINELKGFDNYILKTPVQDLKSQFCLDIRRKMLIKLAKKDYYPNNSFKYKMIEQKYKDCVIPLEEAEWFGLTIEDALAKQNQIDLNSKKLKPLKVIYGQQLIEDIKLLRESGDDILKKVEEEKLGFFDRITSKLPSFMKKD